MWYVITFSHSRKDCVDLDTKPTDVKVSAIFFVMLHIAFNAIWIHFIIATTRLRHQFGSSCEQNERTSRTRSKIHFIVPNFILFLLCGCLDVVASCRNIFAIKCLCGTHRASLMGWWNRINMFMFELLLLWLLSWARGSLVVVAVALAVVVEFVLPLSSYVNNSWTQVGISRGNGRSGQWPIKNDSAMRITNKHWKSIGHYFYSDSNRLIIPDEEWQFDCMNAEYLRLINVCSFRLCCFY